MKYLQCLWSRIRIKIIERKLDYTINAECRHEKSSVLSRNRIESLFKQKCSWQNRLADIKRGMSNV